MEISGGPYVPAMDMILDSVEGSPNNSLHNEANFKRGQFHRVDRPAGLELEPDFLVVDPYRSHSVSPTLSTVRRVQVKHQLDPGLKALGFQPVDSKSAFNLFAFNRQPAPLQRGGYADARQMAARSAAAAAAAAAESESESSSARGWANNRGRRDTCRGRGLIEDLMLSSGTL